MEKSKTNGRKSINNQVNAIEIHETRLVINDDCLLSNISMLLTPFGYKFLIFTIIGQRNQTTPSSTMT